MGRGTTRRGTADPADDLQTIPGVGPSIAQDLRELGIRRVSDLRRRDPERLYRRINALRGQRQDPCLLYVFRCAVYYARTPRPDPVLLKWWTWKDRELPSGGPARARASDLSRLRSESASTAAGSCSAVRRFREQARAGASEGARRAAGRQRAGAPKSYGKR